MSIFQKHCEKAIAQLTDDDIATFKKTNRDEDRIKQFYSSARIIPINPISNGKSLDTAQKAKVKGNQLFAARNYDEALKVYNEGIIQCPQNTDASRELLAILVSNRSATFFEQQQFRKVFDDIDYVLATGSYPQRLHHKIWLRKAKCYDAISNDRFAEETYDLAISSLQYAELDEASLAKKQREIEQSRKTKHAFPNCKNEIIPVSNSDLFCGGNKEFVAAHQEISFEYDPLLGRYARATNAIGTGVVIIEENPHCSVITPENSLTNCQTCHASTTQPVACPNCAVVIFCSLTCEYKANSTFHQIECPFLPNLYQSGASINCAMALRMISQKPPTFFRQKQKILKDYLKDNCKKIPIKSRVHCSDDYITAFFLCRNANSRKKADLVHYSFMAIYLLRLLKAARYFGETQDAVLSDEETFIASLILRHLQILQFNSHEISEIRNAKTACIDGIEICYKSECIGAGLYPTLALFNHSCDPSIVRYNVGNKMVVRTIKPIKAGEIIYENYGPIYTTMALEERRAALQERYWFDCYCSPCQDEWPLFDNMDSNTMKIGCQSEKCPFEFTLHKDDVCPYMQCDYCNNVTKIFPCLKSLTELSTLLPRAEEFFSAGENREATKLYVLSLDKLYKYLRPPCCDMVKVQQRLRTLFIHMGNKQANYVQTF